MEFFTSSTFQTVLSALNSGFVKTLQLFFITLIGALPLGLIISFGSMSRWAPLGFLRRPNMSPLLSGLLGLRPISLVCRLLVWIIRGTPLVLQIIALFYVPGMKDWFNWPSGEGGRFLASAVASLTQPLFNKGANIAQLKIAKAQQEEARLSFEQTLLNAGVEVNEALVQYQTAREKADYYNKQVASLQTAAKSTSLLMKHGNTTYLEVLTAQQTLLNAQLSQVANRFTEIQGVITLYQALGGGRM